MHLRRFAVTILALFATALSSSTTGRPVVAAEPPLRVAIFTVTPDKDPASYVTLRKHANWKFEFLRGHDIRGGRLDEFDVLFVPGGSGSKQAEAMGEDGRQKVREFVQSGGGYLGICAGGYLATDGYSWGLGLIDAHTIDREHWARGTGNVSIQLTEPARSFLPAESDDVQIYYANGPIWARSGRADLGDFETLAEYRSEVRRAGVPGGVMPDTPAAVRGRYGRGRVILFSCHPDIPKPGVTSGLTGWLPPALAWAAGR